MTEKIKEIEEGWLSVKLDELNCELSEIKYFTGFSLYVSKKGFVELRVYRNRRATLNSGLKESLEDAIEIIKNKVDY